MGLNNFNDDYWVLKWNNVFNRDVNLATNYYKSSIDSLLNIWNKSNYKSNWKMYLEYLRGIQWIYENSLYTIDIEILWFLSNLKWAYNITEEIWNKIFNFINIDIEILKNTVNKMSDLWIEINIKNFVSFFYKLNYNISDYELFVLKKLLKKDHNLLNNDTFLKIFFNDFYDIILSLEEIWKEINIINIIDYKIIFKSRPFKYKRFENTDNPKTYENWSPDNNLDIDSYEDNSFPILKSSICWNFWYWKRHETKEQIDLEKIIWSIDQSMNSWTNRSLAWKRDSREYAKLLIKKSDKMLNSFDEDPIKLLKIKWIDWNFVYIISGDWNHRVSAWKMAKLPFINAEVSRVDFPKTINISSEEINDYQNRINNWLIEWYIENNTLHLKSILFDWAFLKKQELIEYIDFYKSIYPNSFEEIKSIL